MVHAPSRSAHGAPATLAGTRSLRGAGPAAGDQAAFSTLGGQRRLQHGQSETHCQGLRARADWTRELLQCELATLRLLLVAQSLALAVAVGDCGQAFLLAPTLEKSDVWVTPLLVAAVEPSRAWRLLKTLLGLMSGPAAWGHHSNVRERLWTMSHMDDSVIVGPWPR